VLVVSCALILFILTLALYKSFTYLVSRVILDKDSLTLSAIFYNIDQLYILLGLLKYVNCC